MSLQFIKNPGLPEARVRYLVIGQRYKEELDSILCKLEIEVFWLPDNTEVDPRLAGHVDLSVCNPVQGTFVFSRSAVQTASELSLFLRSCGGVVLVHDQPQGPNYPEDVALNVCVMGKHILANPQTADSNLLSFTRQLKLIQVRQGYTKCAVCPLDDKTIITGDRGIYTRCCSHGIHALWIDDNFIQLKGYNHGFWGGSAFFIDRDKLAFTGIIPDSHIRKKVENFLDQHEIIPIYLTDLPLFDIGSAVLVLEEF